MRVITNRHIDYVAGADNLNAEMERYASIDGKNDVQVKHFQLWANKSKGAKLKVDGKFRKDDRTAYARYGSEWEKVFKKQYPSYKVSAPDGTRKAGALWNSIKNVWVSAKESGLVDQGLDMLAQRGVNVPRVDPNAPTIPVDPKAPTIPVDTSFPPEEEKDKEKDKHNGWITGLIVVGVIVGAYVIIKKIKK